MLCAVRSNDNCSVVANTQTKADAPFHCPACESAVILRKGRFKIDHFAHKPPVSCAYGVGETELHRRCKTEIFEALLRAPHVTKAALERPLGDVRPDISACINGEYVAIEVQISNLPLETVIHRTREYTRRNIHLLWLAQWTSRLGEDEYSPRPWERWVHAAFFGKVYYWRTGTTIIPYHFDPVLLKVESRDWYNERGEHESAGGYSRRSKRHCKPVSGPVLDLLADFAGMERGPWESKKFIVPAAKLYCDAKPPFWK